MKDVLRVVQKSRHAHQVLIEGESGTGKELSPERCTICRPGERTFVR